MKRNLLSLLFVSVFFVACQKENALVDEQPLAEKTMNNVNYGSDTAQRMDIFLPAGRTNANTKAIVIVHGGAWISGDKTDMNQFIPIIKQRLPDYAIFNINYRLATATLPPSNVFPTQENDMKAAVNFIAGKAGEYNFNTDKIVLLGASAGGHMVLLQTFKNSSPKVKALVDLFGPTDMVDLYNFYTPSPLNLYGIQLLMSGTPTSNPTLYQSSSPINFAGAAAPPTLILHGDADPIVPIRQSTALKAKLETSNVSVTMHTYIGKGHGDWDVATFNDAYDKIISFLQSKNP